MSYTVLIQPSPLTITCLPDVKNITAPDFRFGVWRCQMFQLFYVIVDLAGILQGLGGGGDQNVLVNIYLGWDTVYQTTVLSTLITAPPPNVN